MIGPAWLATIFGASMLVAAVAATVRIIAAWRAHRTTDYQIDIHSVVMGVSMAGMLIPSLMIVSTGPSTIAWLVVWILLTIWFAISVARDAAQRTHGNGFTGHHLPHLVMSAAMIYMFAVMLVPASDNSDSAMSGRSGMSAGGGLVPLATLDYAFVIFMVGYAVLVVDSLPAFAAAGPGDLRVVGRGDAATAARSLAPTTAAIINIAMAITMGYMLTMLFA